jgi:glycosyltransferase involved in cell wall biosynthesis
MVPPVRGARVSAVRKGRAEPALPDAPPPPAASARPATVLLISLLHPELTRGGAQLVCHELFEEMQAQTDINPVLLAADDGTYPALYKSGARITGFDGRPDEYLFLSRDYDNWWHKTSSPLHIAAFAEFLETIRPDFVNFGIDLLSLTRRVLPRARIVFTFHEFFAICAAEGHLIRRTDGTLCSHDSPVRCHQCYPDRGPEQFLLRKMWFAQHFAAVDAFTCPSAFMIEPYVRWGIAREKITHVANGQRDYSGGARLSAASPGRNRFGFFGQFVDVKGVQVLLRAVNILRAEGFTNFSVDLNGDNLRFASAAVRTEIETFLAEEAARPSDERIVTNNGSYQAEQMRGRMSRVDWCVVPSIWQEAFGLVISEAWMFGRPVICANVGGMAERVHDGVDGLHFEVGDPRALASILRLACTDSGLWERLVAALPAPTSRGEMLAGYRRVYGMG